MEIQMKGLWPFGLLGLMAGIFFGLLYAKGGSDGEYQTLPDNGRDRVIDDSGSKPGPVPQGSGQGVKPKGKKAGVKKQDDKKTTD
jgi:hypothetical protein